MERNKRKIYFIINGFLGSEGTIKFIVNCYESVFKYWNILNLAQEPKLILINGFFKSNKKSLNDLLRKRKFNKEDLNLINSDNVEQISLFKFYLKRFSITNLFVGTLSIRNLTVPNISYIYDCQHLILSDNFTKKEKLLRTISFFLSILLCKKILVNSKSVKKDLKNFFTYLPTNKIKSLPFMPLKQNEIEKINLENLKAKFNYLNSTKFVLIANRWWKHKNHISVIKAFHKIQSDLSAKDRENNFRLVITGSKYGLNNRYLEYQEGLNFIKNKNLTNKVHILGHIDDTSLEYLYLNCCGLIQPTLFEGGPGGFCVWRAIDLSKKVACSDISINRELESYVKNINYFDPYSEKEITKVLLKLFLGNLEPTKLLKSSINYQLEYAKSIVNIK